MQMKLKFLMLSLCATPFMMAQTTDTATQELRAASGADDSQFTFTESQLGEDEDMSQNVTIISSNGDRFANQGG